MKKTSFNEISSIILVTSILVAILIVTYYNFALNYKKNVSIKNHKEVLHFISSNISSCKKGEIVLLQLKSSKKVNLCKYFLSKKIPELIELLVEHFIIVKKCNSYKLGLFYNKCIQAVVFEDAMHKGDLGDTIMLVSAGRLIIHTKVSSSKNITNTFAF